MKTLNHLHVNYPSAIIVLDSSLPSEASANDRQTSILVQYIQEEFPDVTLEGVSRKYWNDTAGEQKLASTSVVGRELTTLERFGICRTIDR